MQKVYIKVSFGIQYAWPQNSGRQLYCAAFMPTFKSLLIKYKTNYGFIPCIYSGQNVNTKKPRQKERQALEQE